MSENQPQNPEARYINPEYIAKPFGYTHVVEVLRGRPVYISGQVALDNQGNIVGSDDFEAQAVQVFENLKTALEAVGATFKEVVKINLYLLDMGQLPTLLEIRNRYINVANPPASTAVEVTGLANPKFLLEIEAIALLPE